MANLLQESNKSIQEELNGNAIARLSNRLSVTSSFLEFIEEEEERDMVVLKVRESIIGNLVEELYQRYIDRQVIPFTVRIFERSLTKLLNWYFLPRDPEDSLEDWEEDEPLCPVPIDNWASGCVSVGQYPPPVKFNFSSPSTEDEETHRSRTSEELAEIQELHDSSHSQPQADYRMRRSMSEPVVLACAGPSLTALQLGLAESCVSVAEASTGSKGTKSDGSRQLKKTRFVTPSDRNFKVKRDIYQWINPKNFLAVRVVPEIYHVPGEKFSSKTCGRKGLNKSITIRSNKPTLIPPASEEPRRRCSV